MTQFSKPQTKPAAPRQGRSDTVRNMADMTGRLGLAAIAAAIPAAWPTGVSQLAQAIDACQRCDADQVCSDWLVRAPEAIDLPPAFCPNAPEFARAKQAKVRG